MHKMLWGPTLLFAVLSLVGCNRKQVIVLYTSVDRDVAEPIIRRFEQKTGLKVEIQTDTEATRTAGLAQRLEAEKDRPQADVWWGNEPFHTIRLADAGVLAPYASESATRIPDRFKDPQHRWAGIGLRVRVLAITTAPSGDKAAALVSSIADLNNPALKDRICMANPIAGTTGGHMAAIYTLWGPQKTEQFFRDLKNNGIKLVGGNSIVAELVGQGQMWAGLTDNDDVSSAQRENGKLKAVLPDQQHGQIGTLLIPTTVGLVSGGPHPEEARKLIDYLLSDEAEKMLLDAHFATASVMASGNIWAMDIDYTKVARNMKPAVELALKVFESR